MKTSLVVPFLALGARHAIAQTADGFEAPDFNITEALIRNGINISAIPELSGLTERTLLSGCSVAVCPPARSIGHSF